MLRSLSRALQLVQVWRTRRRSIAYEIKMCDGLELRYHTGEPGNWVGVKKHKGVRKTSYQACISITKHKGNIRRQYGLGSFGLAEEAAIGIARELVSSKQ